MLIATHDGTFHADETVAAAIISYLFAQVSIIRSRDPKELEKADLIIDVSGINDERHFDHHAPDFHESRPNGINYATAGLMWRKFGIDFLKKIAKQHQMGPYDPAIIQRAAARIDKEIMWAVDLNDNGQLNEYLTKKLAPAAPEAHKVFDELNDFYQDSPSIPFLVAMQNLPNISNAEQDQHFAETVKILKVLLINCAVNALKTEEGIGKVLQAYKQGPLLVMYERLPWTQAVFAHMDKFKDCLLALYPDRKNGWRVQSLPVSRARRFANRLSAPLAWRGLNFEDLDKASGLQHTIFVHRAGFTGGALDYDSAVRMAELWLKQGVPAAANAD